MQDLIARLRARSTDAFERGFSEAAITEFERRLGLPLPPDLAALYRDHNGMRDGAGLSMRLMTAGEVLGTTPQIAEFFPGYLSEEAALFWVSGDESLFIGLFLTGALAPRGFLFDLDERDDTPRFFDARGVVTALLAEAENPAQGLVPDYPCVIPWQGEAAEADRTLGRAFLDAYLADDEQARAAYTAIALLPVEDTALLLPLLRSPNAYVQAQACEVMGLRAYAPAVPHLLEVARNGNLVSHGPALQALLQIDTPEAADAVRQIARETGAKLFPGFS